MGMARLPAGAHDLIATATEKSLNKALDIAIKTINSNSSGSFENGQENSFWTDLAHKGATAVTGAVSGAAGIMALAIELPLTTGIMLRGVSSIAHDYGHDINHFKIRLECLSIFAMGSASPDDDAINSAYFTSRIAMARLVEDAAKWAANKSAQELTEALATKSAPVLIQLVKKIAERFNVVVTENALGKIIPGIAIFTGALMNAAFTDHFNAVARYHFGIRALEERYGEALIRAIYDKNKPST